MTALALVAALVLLAVLWLYGSWRLDRATRPGAWDAETDERTQLAPEDEDPGLGRYAVADTAALARHHTAAAHEGLFPKERMN